MWFKVDSSLCQHPKALMAGAEAMGLWTLAGAWSCGQLTDGFIPEYLPGRLVADGEALASRLLHANLWFRVDGGYQFHEWDERQPSAEEERERQDQRREAGRKGGVSSGKSRRKAARTKRVEATAQAGAQAGAQADAQADAQAKPEAKTKPDTDTEGVPKGTPPCSPRSDRFDEFWSAYPCKKAKKAAHKSWQQAIKDTDPDTIINAARRYAESRAGQDPQYTAMPTTWLNQGRWDDELSNVSYTPPARVPTKDAKIAAFQQLRNANNDPPDGTPHGFRQLPGGDST